MRRTSTSKYKSTNATLTEEVNTRKYLKNEIDKGKINGINGEKPYAVAYGVTDASGKRKLFKHMLVFYSGNGFDDYVKKHRQIVLAIYSHR